MARSLDWEQLPMALGDPAPAWPLAGVTPKFATWSVGGGRPFGCTVETCQRWHAGIDLTGAPDDTTILAPEDALVVGIDRGWSEGARAAFLRTRTGLFLVLGGFKAGSHKAFGIQQGGEVRKGDKLGKILGSYGMIHLETYTAASRVANSVWWKSEPPPDGLLNPTNYIERMVGDRVSLVQTRQRHEALATLGYYKGSLDAAWGPASEAALKAAQRALGIPADGKWGPQTEDAIHSKLAPECTADTCSAVDEAADKTEGALRPNTAIIGRLIIGAAALSTLAVGLAVWKGRA